MQLCAQHGPTIFWDAYLVDFFRDAPNRMVKRENW